MQIYFSLPTCFGHNGYLQGTTLDPVSRNSSVYVPLLMIKLWNL